MPASACRWVWPAPELDELRSFESRDPRRSLCQRNKTCWQDPTDHYSRWIAARRDPISSGIRARLGHMMRGMSMLGWNKKKSDHPMADDKAAKQFLAELTTADSFKLLEEVSFWLDATRTAEGLKPLRAYEIVEQLDAAARPHQRKLAQEFLAAGNRR